MSAKDKILEGTKGWTIRSKLIVLFAAFGIIPMLIAFGLTAMSGHVQGNLIIEEIIELVVVSIVVVATGYMFGRSLGGRLDAVSDAVERLAEGDTAVSAAKQSADEIGRIWASIEKLKTAVAENVRVKEMVEAMAINVMTADLQDFKIDYANKATLDPVRQLEHVMPVKADALIGTCIDIFHKDPSHQRQLLADPKNLPHQAVIEFAGEYLDLLVSPLTDANGTYVGPMVSWSVVTDKVKADREAARLLNMVNEMPINVMTCDPEDFTINYVNKTSLETLKTVEHLLP